MNPIAWPVGILGALVIAFETESTGELFWTGYRPFGPMTVSSEAVGELQYLFCGNRDAQGRGGLDPPPGLPIQDSCPPSEQGSTIYFVFNDLH